MKKALAVCTLWCIALYSCKKKDDSPQDSPYHPSAFIQSITYSYFKTTTRFGAWIAGSTGATSATACFGYADSTNGFLPEITFEFGKKPDGNRQYYTAHSVGGDSVL